jgi:hypothetical protein
MRYLVKVAPGERIRVCVTQPGEAEEVIVDVRNPPVLKETGEPNKSDYLAELTMTYSGSLERQGYTVTKAADSVTTESAQAFTDILFGLKEGEAERLKGQIDYMVHYLAFCADLVSGLAVVRESKGGAKNEKL